MWAENNKFNNITVIKPLNAEYRDVNENKPGTAQVGAPLKNVSKKVQNEVFETCKRTLLLKFHQFHNAKKNPKEYG